MVGYRLYSRRQLRIPQSVKGIGPGIVTKPVNAGQPYFLTGRIQYAASVCVQPVIALFGILRTYQQILHRGTALLSVIVAVIVTVVITVIIVLVILRVLVHLACHHGHVFAV